MNGEPVGRPGWRAFRWGLGAGVATAVVLAAAGLVALKLGTSGPLWQPFNVKVSVSGADVTRHLGRQLVVRNEHGSLTQTCRGACDDLTLLGGGSDNVYWVHVTDARGRCVACTPTGAYVTSSVGINPTRIDVAGRDRLTVREIFGGGESRPPVLSD